MISRPPAANTKRAIANRAADQEALRKKIAAGKHHEHVAKCISKLVQIDVEVRARRYFTREDQAKYMTRVAALRTAMDGHLKLLSKYLPDLRNVELGVGDDETPLGSAFRAWAEALDRGVDG